VTTRSGRGRWQRVLQAREQARAALGHGPLGGDAYGAPKRKTPPAPPPMPTWPRERPPERPDESLRVLSLGEAAARLVVSRSELEAMIAAGTVEALPTGFTRIIPVSEVARLKVRPMSGHNAAP
jgi:hypothetical protein